LSEEEAPIIYARYANYNRNTHIVVTRSLEDLKRIASFMYKPIIKRHYKTKNGREVDEYLVFDGYTVYRYSEETGGAK